MKEDNTKVDGSSKPRNWHLQQSTLSPKDAFKAPIPGLEYKVFDLVKQMYTVEFLKNCKAISKLIAVNYKHGWPKMDMATKNIDKSVINVP